MSAAPACRPNGGSLPASRVATSRSRSPRAIKNARSVSSGAPDAAVTTSPSRRTMRRIACSAPSASEPDARPEIARASARSASPGPSTAGRSASPCVGPSNDAEAPLVRVFGPRDPGARTIRRRRPSVPARERQTSAPARTRSAAAGRRGSAAPRGTARRSTAPAARRRDAIARERRRRRHPERRHRLRLDRLRERRALEHHLARRFTDVGARVRRVPDAGAGQHARARPRARRAGVRGERPPRARRRRDLAERRPRPHRARSGPAFFVVRVERLVEDRQEVGGQEDAPVVVAGDHADRAVLDVHPRLGIMEELLELGAHRHRRELRRGAFERLDERLHVERIARRRKIGDRRRRVARAKRRRGVAARNVRGGGVVARIRSPCCSGAASSVTTSTRRSLSTGRSKTRGLCESNPSSAAFSRCPMQTSAAADPAASSRSRSTAAWSWKLKGLNA